MALSARRMFSTHAVVETVRTLTTKVSLTFQFGSALAVASTLGTVSFESLHVIPRGGVGRILLEHRREGCERFVGVASEHQCFPELQPELG